MEVSETKRAARGILKGVGSDNSPADEVITLLIESKGSSLVRLAYQLTHDAGAAEDLVQDALLRVHASWSRRSPVEVNSPEAYVRRAIVHRYLALRRLRRSSEIVTDRHVEQVDGSDFVDRMVDRDALWMQMVRLPRKQRVALVLRYYEDLPDREIAGVMGCAEATVRTLVRRGLSSMRQQQEPIATTSSLERGTS